MPHHGIANKLISQFASLIPVAKNKKYGDLIWLSWTRLVRKIHYTQTATLSHHLPLYTNNFWFLSGDGGVWVSSSLEGTTILRPNVKNYIYYIMKFITIIKFDKNFDFFSYKTEEVLRFSCTIGNNYNIWRYNSHNLINLITEHIASAGSQKQSSSATSSSTFIQKYCL